MRRSTPFGSKSCLHKHGLKCFTTKPSTSLCFQPYHLTKLKSRHMRKEKMDYNWTTSTTTEADEDLNQLDELIAPGLRLWMLLAMILGILLLMVIVVCCFIKIRIPRTKREIELMAAKRRLRRQKGALPVQDVRDELVLCEQKRRSKKKGRKGDKVNDERGQDPPLIVMQSLATQLSVPATSDGDTTSYAESCGDYDDTTAQSHQNDPISSQPKVQLAGSNASSANGSEAMSQSLLSRSTHHQTAV